MTTQPDLTESTVARRSRLTVSVVRSLVGASTWLSPRHAPQAFAPGLVGPAPEAAFVGRLFGVRDLALGLAAQHPDASTRRAALQTGVAVDAVDAVAAALALRRGAPKLGAAAAGLGALTFVALGLVALSDGPTVDAERAQTSV